MRKRVCHVNVDPLKLTGGVGRKFPFASLHVMGYRKAELLINIMYDCEGIGLWSLQNSDHPTNSVSKFMSFSLDGWKEVK